MLEEKKIFEILPADFKSIFVGMPWEPLDRLKEFLLDTIKPSFNKEKIDLYTPLKEHILIMPDGELVKNRFEIIKDEKSEKPQIYYNGDLIKDATLLCAGAILTDPLIQIGKGCIIEPCALIKGPTIIGDNTEIRHSAYIRGNSFIGDNCVVGHTTEVKSSIFLNGAKAGHFAYVGDSILGNNVNLGAGTKLANLRFAKGNITIKIEDKIFDTGRKKLGAILGDNTQTGCNSVTNPGVITGKDCLILPNTSVMAGFYKPNSIIKNLNR